MRHLVLQASVLAPILALCACSSIIEGTSQDIAVDTTPAGASCDFIRKYQTIATISSTPGTAKIDKTKNDILISCSKSGFVTATFLNHSDVAGVTVGNVVAGGGIGWAVDSSLGADNKYDSPIHLALSRVQPDPPPDPRTHWGP